MAGARGPAGPGPGDSESVAAAQGRAARPGGGRRLGPLGRQQQCQCHGHALARRIDSDCASGATPTAPSQAGGGNGPNPSTVTFRVTSLTPSRPGPEVWNPDRLYEIRVFGIYRYVLPVTVVCTEYILVTVLVRNTENHHDSVITQAQAGMASVTVVRHGTP